jgi:hypothetical protein
VDRRKSQRRGVETKRRRDGAGSVRSRARCISHDNSILHWLKRTGGPQDCRGADPVIDPEFPEKCVHEGDGQNEAAGLDVQVVLVARLPLEAARPALEFTAVGELSKLLEVLGKSHRKATQNLRFNKLI